MGKEDCVLFEKDGTEQMWSVNAKSLISNNHHHHYQIQTSGFS